MKNSLIGYVIGIVIVALVIAFIVIIAYSPSEGEANWSTIKTRNATTTDIVQSHQLPNFQVIDGNVLTVRAQVANTGLVYLGYSSSTAAATYYRFILYPGDSVALVIDNANALWMRTSVTNEGVALITEDN